MVNTQLQVLGNLKLAVSKDERLWPADFWRLPGQTMPGNGRTDNPIVCCCIGRKAQ